MKVGLAKLRFRAERYRMSATALLTSHVYYMLYIQRNMCEPHYVANTILDVILIQYTLLLVIVLEFSGQISAMQ